MDLSLTDEQQQLTEAFARLYEHHATPERVREAEPGGFDKALWERLVETGAVAMAVPEAAGGWGASPVDLVLIAELHGRAVAAAPLIEAQVAARLLARLGQPVADDRLVTLAAHPPVGGVAKLVPAAAVADEALVYDGTRIVRVALDGARTPVENLGSAPLADVVVPADAEVLAEGPAAAAAFEQAWDEALLLTAAALVGMGARVIEIAAAYARERKAWDVPIGSFQAVAHPLADAAAAVDGARLLAWKAAWSQHGDPTRAGELAALAFAFASDTVNDATYHALHVHGGYGFMMEYDVQLYWRRARAWAQVWAAPAVAYRRAAAARAAQRASEVAA